MSCAYTLTTELHPFGPVGAFACFTICLSERIRSNPDFMTGEKAMLLCVYIYLYIYSSAQRPTAASLCVVIPRMDLSLPEQAPCLPPEVFGMKMLLSEFLGKRVPSALWPVFLFI